MFFSFPRSTSLLATVAVLAIAGSLTVIGAGSAQPTRPLDAVAAPPDPCAVAGGESARIATVEDLGDVRLEDGRLARLADLDLGVDAIAAGRWPDHVAALRSALSGLRVRADAGGAFPDRWGRRPLRLSPEPDGPSIHRRLVEAGLARVAPLGDHEACAASLLAVESAAREKNLGLWREPGARLLDAGEPGAIRALTGRFAIVQGTVLTVGERPRRVYLNFGRDFARDMSATMTPRAARLLEKAGIAPSSLRGRVVRVRGIVSGRRAPAIEIAGAGQIEVVK